MTHGMPHLGAHYETADVNSHTLDDGAYCAFCGARAVHAHHEPPKQMGGGNSYRELGGVEIRPALIALCAECHAARHSGRLRIEWVWLDVASMNEWNSGFPLENGFVPHDLLLFEIGYWQFTSLTTTRIVRRYLVD